MSHLNQIVYPEKKPSSLINSLTFPRDKVSDSLYKMVLPALSFMCIDRIYFSDRIELTTSFIASWSSVTTGNKREASIRLTRSDIRSSICWVLDFKKVRIVKDISKYQ